MKIFIYWNYKDHDSKKIFQFLKKDSFINALENAHHVKIYREYRNFLLDGRMLEDMASSDLIMFFTHGDDDAVLKFRYKDASAKKQFTFVGMDNAHILNDKKVIAICCRSAKVLGRYCVGEEVKSRFYIGFRDDLIYSENFSSDFKTIVYKTYSDAFEMTLLDACNKNWTAEKFVRMLRKNMVDTLTKEILASKDRKLGSSSGVSFHRKTAESLEALGQSGFFIFK